MAISDGHQDRTLQILLPEDRQAQQCLWLTSGVAINLYESRNLKHCRQSMKQQHVRASDLHRQLWPGSAVPNIAPIPGSHQHVEEAMPTSLLIAYVGSMVGFDKRWVDDRKRAHDFLKLLIDRLAIYHPKFHFLFTDIQGNGTWVEQELKTAYSCVPWSAEFFNNYLRMTWMSDLSSRSKPWVSSHPTEGQIHLADFLSFSLDKPKWIYKKCNSEILWAKQVVERSALSLLTQLALLLEQHLMDLTTPLNRAIGKMGKKLNKVEKWAYVAQAMDLVFSQQDTGISEFRQMFAHVYDILVLFIFLRLPTRLD